MTDEDAPDAALRAEGLEYSYGDGVAVDEVSFEVAPGEILGLLGPGGAGKSTIIKLLTGQLPSGQGTVEILGLAMPAQRKAIATRIGVCFEARNLYPSLTARENLTFFARLFRVEGFDVDALLDRVALGDRAGERVAGLSGEMQQRLMLAWAPVNRPEILFVDEPTDGLDAASAQAIRAILREEAHRGVAVVLATHDMHEADELSDRVALVNEGKILALDTPEVLKLSHGRRTVTLRFRDGDGVKEEVVVLDHAAGERLRWLVSREGLLTIDTEEATLEDVFSGLAGRRLA